MLPLEESQVISTSTLISVQMNGIEFLFDIKSKM